MTVADPVLSGYQWLVVLGAFGAFIFGYGTGANDVANAFGTSVGARTLTLKQAVVIAAIFEFGGALLLGRVSTSTIAGGIADINEFTREPEMYAYGMMIALMVSGCWNIIASYFELNVSSTHSIIGSIMGFSLIYGGGGAVLWAEPAENAFPPYKGVVPIVVCWFFAPVATALVSSFFFFMCRLCILRRARGVLYTVIALPILVFLTVYICVFFVLTKGAKKMISEDDDSWNDEKAAWVSAATAAGMFGLVCLTVCPFLWWKTKKAFNEDGTKKVDEAKVEKEAKDLEAAAKQAEHNAAAIEGEHGKSAMFMAKFKHSMSRSKDIIMHGMEVDVHEVIEDDEIVAEIHKRAEVFDPRIEYCFSWLQVFSAICVVFAHGAGEVGYMAGPLATIWSTYTEGTLTKNVTAPIWVILISAFGLVIGLATYGYKCTRGMGVRLSKLSPSRGFCAELATAGVILAASQYALPTSSSQCITGGIIGVGLLEGAKGVNWIFFLKQFSSWVATLFVVGLLTAAIFAQGVYAPSKLSGAAQVTFEDRITNLTLTLYKNYQAALTPYNVTSAPILGNYPNTTVVNVKNLNAAIAAASKSAASLTDTKTQTANPDQVVNALLNALALYQSSTVLSIGQTRVYAGAATGACNSAAADSAACVAPKMVPSGFAPKAPGL